MIMKERIRERISQVAGNDNIMKKRARKGD
jgi:methyltransferase-like protein